MWSLSSSSRTTAIPRTHKKRRSKSSSSMIHRGKFKMEGAEARYQTPTAKWNRNLIVLDDSISRFIIQATWNFSHLKKDWHLVNLLIEKMITIYKMIRGQAELESLEDLLLQEGLGTRARIMVWLAMTSSTTVCWAQHWRIMRSRSIAIKVLPFLTLKDKRWAPRSLTWMTSTKARKK